MKITIFLFLISCHAMAATVVFELRGQQYLHDVGAGGSVTKEATIIWDERKDGPFPVGVDPLTASLVDGKLVADSEKITAKAQVDLDKAAKEAAEAAELASLRPILEKIDAENTMTAAEQRKFNKAVKKKLGL